MARIVPHVVLLFNMTAECVGCWDCVMACPHGLLTILGDKTGELAAPVLKDPKRCTGCRECVSECKQGALTCMVWETEEE
jgi:NAD-dependent dihydropyrimidine dehydrogenase PreA subunit